ncbi:MAG: diaminopimelate epimerase [Planctomycetota bacterium]
MMTVRFTKMQGAGNDYVYVDLTSEVVEDPAPLARAISERRFGVGADGLILIAPSARAAARMEMYNNDGSRAAMCGNGIRCVAKYLFDRGRAPAVMMIDTDAGLRRVEILERDGRAAGATVDMGVPELEPSRIPMRFAGAPPRSAIEYPLDVNGQKIPLTALSLGNPHAVIFVECVVRAPVAVLGPAIENHAAFPERVNVSFVEVLNASHVRQRTWERGSGETLACGTGATAGAVAAILTGRARTPLTVSLPGGDLEVAWEGQGKSSYLTGPAVEVFRGEWVGER